MKVKGFIKKHYTIKGAIGSIGFLILIIGMCLQGFIIGRNRISVGLMWLGMSCIYWWIFFDAAVSQICNMNSDRVEYPEIIINDKYRKFFSMRKYNTTFLTIFIEECISHLFLIVRILLIILCVIINEYEFISILMSMTMLLELISSFIVVLYNNWYGYTHKKDIKRKYSYSKRKNHHSNRKRR